MILTYCYIALLFKSLELPAQFSFEVLSADVCASLKQVLESNHFYEKNKKDKKEPSCLITHNIF